MTTDVSQTHSRTVDFKNTIIILTSNLGSPYILEGITPEGEISQEARDKVDALLKQQFRPEFLNRLDDIIYYKPLMKTEIYKIVDLMLAELGKRLEDKRLSIEVTDAAKEAIVNQGYDQNFGARLSRGLSKDVSKLLSQRRSLQTSLSLILSCR